jgi:hypothetical protein
MPSAPVVIDLGDGKSRTLRFNARALRLLERESGKSVFQLIDEASRLTTTAVLLWAGLRAENPELTLEQVDELLDGYMGLGHQYFELLEPIAEALVEAGVVKRKSSNGSGNGSTPPPVEPGPG